MRQKLAEPSNSSSNSEANLQGNSNGKLFPNVSKFYKSNMSKDIHPPKKSDIDDDTLKRIRELVNGKYEVNSSVV